MYNELAIRQTIAEQGIFIAPWKSMKETNHFVTIQCTLFRPKSQMHDEQP